MKPSMPIKNKLTKKFILKIEYWHVYSSAEIYNLDKKKKILKRTFCRIF